MYSHSLDPSLKKKNRNKEEKRGLALIVKTWLQFYEYIDYLRTIINWSFHKQKVYNESKELPFPLKVKPEKRKKEKKNKRVDQEN